MSDTDPRDSNPNAAGPQGLRGDMGVSSERTGPAGGTEDESADEGVQGTGTTGSATENTEGTMSTERKHTEEPAEGSRDVGTPGADSAPSQPDESTADEDPSISGSVAGADGPEMDDTQQRATQEWRDGQPAAGDDKGEINRTVGESNTAEVPSHEFDRTKNPGHSHG